MAALSRWKQKFCDGKHLTCDLSQAGIVAWGIGCGSEGVPGGYVNVASFTCWIKSIVERVRFKLCSGMAQYIILFQVEGKDFLPFTEECSSTLSCSEKLCS